MRAVRVPIKWEGRLQGQCRASAGPNPSISGMKKLYWGKDAPVVSCGGCAYLLTVQDYQFYAARY